MDWGIGSAPDSVDREVVVRMNDQMRFEPEHLEVEEGETLRLVVHNDGQLLHEFVLGDPDTLAEHAELMKQFPDMEHAEPYMAHVAPGESETLVWTFNRAGRFEFACLLPGHFEAGMKGTLEVSSVQIN